MATLSHLPVEILRKIISYLPDYDRISFALTENRLFDVWVPSLGCLDFRTSYNLNMDVLNDYFTNQAPTITEVNFGNCYWVDPDGLAEVVANLHSVEHLQLHGIKLKSTHLLNIFKSCQKITHLTVSFDGFDSTFWKLEPDADEDDRQTFRYNCIFYEWRDRLANLKYLKLHGDSFCHIMFSVLLSFCSRLEELHIEFSTRYQATFTQNISMSRLVSELSPMQPSNPDLHWLTCIVNDNVDNGIITRFLCCLLFVKESELQVFWVPEVYIDTFVGQLASFDDFRAAGSSDHTLDFDTLTNLHGNCALSHIVDKLPRLKLLSCICDHPRLFADFARNHGHLEELQLKVIDYNFPSDEHLNSGFEYLTRLKRLCISPKLLASSELTHLTRSCPQLEELEIANWSDRKTSYSMEAEALSSIAKCQNLERLTLSGIEVSGESPFFLKIIKDCSKLKSLRIGNTKGQHVISQLANCLQDAPKLADFRLEMAEVDDLEPVFKSLNQCTSLRRWVVITHFLKNPDTLTRVVREWPRLVLACLIVPCSVYPEPFKVVSKHPAFTWCFGSSFRDAVLLPEVHYNDLVVFDSKICKRPI